MQVMARAENTVFLILSVEVKETKLDIFSDRVPIQRELRSPSPGQGSGQERGLDHQSAHARERREVHRGPRAEGAPVGHHLSAGARRRILRVGSEARWKTERRASGALRMLYKVLVQLRTRK